MEENIFPKKLIIKIFEQLPDKDFDKSVYDELFDIFTSKTNLTPKQLEVIKYRYGLYGKVYTYTEIGNILGVSLERVRQIEGRYLRGIRYPSIRRKLKKYL